VIKSYSIIVYKGGIFVNKEIPIIREIREERRKPAYYIEAFRKSLISFNQLIDVAVVTSVMAGEFRYYLLRNDPEQKTYHALWNKYRETNKVLGRHGSSQTDGYLRFIREFGGGHLLAGLFNFETSSSQPEETLFPFFEKTPIQSQKSLLLDPPVGEEASIMKILFSSFEKNPAEFHLSLDIAIMDHFYKKYIPATVNKITDLLIYTYCPDKFNFSSETIFAKFSGEQADFRNCFGIPEERWINHGITQGSRLE